MYDSKYEKINETTLMNSGDEPNRTINSIAFYNEDVFGLDKMYRYY